MNNVIRYSLAATVLALGMVLSSSFISRFFVSVKHEQGISVKGFAEAAIVSDIGQLELTVRARDVRREVAYQSLTGCLSTIAAKVKQSPPADLSIELLNPRFQEVHRLNEKGLETHEVDSYVGTQSLTLASSDVQWIKKISQELNELIGGGYDIRVYAPTFLVSNLAQIKQELLEKATADGYRRAELMAKNSGARVGELRAARQGIFQITEPNSTETSSYGIYDTSTIPKCIKAVVTLEYAVE